jgi:phosphoribosylformylglycinamidine synthase PurS subunit
VRFLVTVEVSGLEGISDPEGQTIEKALPLLGFSEVGHVRTGRLFRFDLEAPGAAEAEERSKELCDRLLANPVIEKAEVHVAASPS